MVAVAVVRWRGLLSLLDLDRGCWCRGRRSGRGRLLASINGRVDGCGHDINVGDNVTLVWHGERAGGESSGDNGGTHCCCSVLSKRWVVKWVGLFSCFSDEDHGSARVVDGLIGCCC